MNKFVLVGIFFVIFFAGLVIILINQSIGFNDMIRALGDLSPRVLSLLALPFIAMIFVLGVYLRKRSEDRVWKNAVKKTLSKKQIRS